MEKEITIKYKPNLDKLVKVSKYLLFNIPYLKWIILFIPVILLKHKIISLFTGSYKAIEWDIFDALPLVLIIFIWFFAYIRLSSNIKKKLVKDKRNLETQKITFNRNSYIQEGETFKIENFWNEMYQIKETKSWLLIYVQKNSALPIIKEDLNDNQYNELKQLFNSLDIKKSLKS
ncbi:MULTISPECIES: YcxB family protein [unclassified Flavobacterium]|jgi:hypothetical protein|uniref:YcxB family protein n=1 Tax=unclassified Flavobacterium TaxID=196869 RepID=UPI00064A3309|nr:YcxB family protein [Flavobacterium sp. ABG]KLT68674.1 hypothetical protein AB674_16750 [Flavobacterium sp. ABG]